MRRFAVSTIAICVLSAAALGACSKSPATAEAPEPAPPAKQAAVTAAPDIIANFTLADQNGVSHELYSMKDKAAIVLVMQGVGCPIVQKMTPDLKTVKAAYESKNVQFVMLNSNMQDKPQAIHDELKNFDLDIVALKDADQKVGLQIGAVRTAETFVIDPKTWRIVYHGPLNDRLTYGREKAVASSNYVPDVLDAVLAGKDVPNIRQQADGCIINFPKANG